MEKKKIVITGGVLTPAMAVIAELQRRGGWEIYYFGRKHTMEGDKNLSAEAKIIPKLGVEFIPLVAGRLQRRFTRYTIPALLHVPVGFLQAWIALRKVKPDIICSFGGYVSVPVVIAGWLLRVPILTHEQTVVFGLASKINAFFAQRIAVSFASCVNHFPKKKVVLAGNPIRREIFSYKKAPDWVTTTSHLPVIYITGGNQGSHLINQAVVAALPRLLEKFVVIHQTGARDYEEISKIKYQIPKEGQGRYFITLYVGSEEIGWIYNKADLIVSRAGANTVCEIAVLGKPAILIPIPWSYQDEQTKNAKMLVEAGLVELLPQSELSGESLVKKIFDMAGRLSAYHQKASKAKELIILDGDKKIVDEIYSLIQKK